MIGSMFSDPSPIALWEGTGLVVGGGREVGRGGGTGSSWFLLSQAHWWIRDLSAYMHLWGGVERNQTLSCLYARVGHIHTLYWQRSDRGPDK